MGATQYDVHPGVAMVRKWADDLPGKTGRTLDEWAAIARTCPLVTPKERAGWLKSQYGFGSNTAWYITEYATNTATWDGDPAVYLRQAPQYVDGMFAGGKAHLRPIFEVLAAAARELGADVKVCPCKTIVPFYRKRVFAEVKPATKTRLELALALGDAAFKGKLVPNPRAKGNDRLRHLIPLATVKDVDAGVLKWLKTAYAANA